MDFKYTDEMCYRTDEVPFMPENPMLANAYVPFQQIDCIFNPVKGLSMGTIFPELVRPYMKQKDGCGCRRYDK